MEHGSVASRPYLGSRREPAPRRWQQMELCGTELARELLVRGFCFEGQRVPLVAPQGIFKPAVLPELPLSITTALRQRDFRERVLLAYQVGCSICLLRQRDVQRGPADALRVRRRAPAPTDPGAFCAALLGPLRYVLPADVDEGTWQLALRHFARRGRTSKTSAASWSSELGAVARRAGGTPGPESRRRCCASGSAMAWPACSGRDAQPVGVGGEAGRRLARLESRTRQAVPSGFRQAARPA